MDFKGKLVFMMMLVVVLLGCASMGVQADGPQPCKYIKIKEMEDGKAQCEKCCTKAGLIMGTSANACRCIDQYRD